MNLDAIKEIAEWDHNWIKKNS